MTEPTWLPNNCTVSQLKGVKVQEGAAGGGYDPQLCPRMSYLDLHEQRSLVTLWSIARSPLIMGGDLLQSPPETIALLTNRDILEMNSDASGAMQLDHDSQGGVAWKSDATGAGRLGNGTYLALFNLAPTPRTLAVGFGQIYGRSAPASCAMKELWSGASLGRVHKEVTAKDLPRHGTQVFFLSNCQK